MNQADAIDAIERAAAFLLTSPDPVVRGVGIKITQWFEGNGIDHLEQSFGLGLPGPRSISAARAIAERDRLLRHAASQFFAHLSQSGQAEALAASLEKYQTTAWKRVERNLSKCPSRHDNDVRAVFWQILKLQDRVLSARHVRRLLATSSEDLANDVSY